MLCNLLQIVKMKFTDYVIYNARFVQNFFSFFKSTLFNAKSQQLFVILLCVSLKKWLRE